VLEKVKMARETCDRHAIRQGGISAKEGPRPESLPLFDIQVDGGINVETAKKCIEAGANVLVSGDYLFKLPDLSKGIQALRNTE
jgi:ribulose-phosphate 3-epimerase